MTVYRPLTSDEIARLEARQCSADDWSELSVSEDFDPAQLWGCRFTGPVTIGSRARLHNIRGHLSNYRIGEEVLIEDVGTLETVGYTTFGNGTRINAVNENGGRAVPICDRLSAQTAYTIAMYRHRPETVGRITGWIDAHAAARRDRLGEIGPGARIRNTNCIRNVRVGAGAEICGADLLQEGTIGEHSRIGSGTKLYDFIVASHSSVDNGTLLRNAYVGQAVRLSAFTADHSLFFANSHLENGEAVSIFAGPHTVSHHKSSLLIAGLFSFFNAGSGANQSNHLFKTGAVHQGIHLRGCKFGSNAYQMLPVANGPFTVVLGRHTKHPDTTFLPYSYLVEEEGQSWIIPAMNLRSYGTVRDLAKWPSRDARPENPLDRIVYDEYSPYLGQYVREALDQLEAMWTRPGDTLLYERAKIRASALRQGIRLYRMQLDRLVGHWLNRPAEPTGTDISRWVDLGGMTAPAAAVDAVLDAVDTGRIDSLDALEKAWDDLSAAYPAHAAAWALATLAAETGHLPDTDEIAAAIERGNTAEAHYRHLTEEDARRDSDALARIGYGQGAGNAQEMETDFRAVRNLNS